MVSGDDKARLRLHAESMPEWLISFQRGGTFPTKEFLQSRLVIYPGSGTDGRPVELFGSTHAAHCFLYADYILPRTSIESQLDHPAHHFRGYRSLDRLTLAETDLTPRGWKSHLHANNVVNAFGHAHVRPFGFLEILERESAFDDEHGPERLAILFLGADGIATYDALFCQQNGIERPFGLIVVDHGFGGGYARFDNGGLLHELARRCSVFPEYIWIPNTDSDPWEGYQPVDPTGEHKPTLYKNIS